MIYKVKNLLIIINYNLKLYNYNKINKIQNINYLN